MDALHLTTRLTLDADTVKAPNLCSRFGYDELAAIGEYCHSAFLRDDASRAQWKSRMRAAIDLALQVQKAKTFPWAGSSNVVFPLITIAALQFSARAYSTLIQGTDIVRYRVFGDDPQGTVFKRAERIGRHMSWQVLEQDTCWEEQQDRLLIILAIIGTAFKKDFFSASKGFPISELVMPQDLVFDYWAKSVEDCDRKTQIIPLYRNEVYTRIMQETFRDIRKEPWWDAPPPTSPLTGTDPRDNRKGQQPSAADQATAFRFLEQHCWFDFDGDGYAEPYIVTFDEASRCVVRIVCRCEPEDIQRNDAGEVVTIRATEFYTKYSFIPNPDGGVLDLGFGIFLGPINEAVNAGINQLIDSGTFQNSLGGFLGRGMKIRGGVYNMAPWQFVRVDSTGDDIKKNLVMFPDRQPSEVLLKMVELLIDYANRIAGTVDVNVGENPGQNTPASTFQGMQESGLQVFSMTMKRVWRSQKEEFKKRYLLNRKYISIVSKRYGEGPDTISREDYLDSPDQIAPVADPAMSSTTLRVNQAMIVAQRAMAVPGYNIEDVERRLHKALGLEGSEKLYPGPGKVPPLPNFRLQIQEMKLQGEQAKLALQRQEWANKLMEERRKNTAMIHQLEAQAAKLLKEAGNVGVAEKLKAFELALDTLNAHQDRLLEHAKLAAGAEGEGSNSDEGGVRGVAGGADNAGVQGNAPAGAGGNQGPMGQPSLPGANTGGDGAA